MAAYRHCVFVSVFFCSFSGQLFCNSRKVGCLTEHWLVINSNNNIPHDCFSLENQKRGVRHLYSPAARLSPHINISTVMHSLHLIQLCDKPFWGARYWQAETVVRRPDSQTLRWLKLRHKTRNWLNKGWLLIRNGLFQSVTSLCAKGRLIRDEGTVDIWFFLSSQRISPQQLASKVLLQVAGQYVCFCAALVMKPNQNKLDLIKSPKQISVLISRAYLKLLEANEEHSDSHSQRCHTSTTKDRRSFR